MHKLLQKVFDIKHDLSSGGQQTTVDGAALAAGLSAFVTEQDFYRYRKQKGVNLGSWFVLERWITDHPYRQAREPGQSDLDIALGNQAKQILEEHWRTWVQAEDWRWIVERGLNTVRIPIGYYHLCALDPHLLDKTDFAGLYNVFSNAWSMIYEAILTAQFHRLGVMIDLHAGVGKQNNDSHAGTSKPSYFFLNEFNRTHTTNILKLLCTNLASFYNVIGIELLNEPLTGHDDILQRWYTNTICELRKINLTIPIIIGDCWKMDEYTNFVSRLNEDGASGDAPIIIDHHVYRCFSPGDISTPIRDHTASFSNRNEGFPRMLSQNAENAGKSGGGIVIGEWSGGMNPQSFAGNQGRENELTREYIQTQLGAFDACCEGWYFWTLKKQWPGDIGWSLRDSVGARVFPNWVGIKRTKSISSGILNQRQVEERREENKRRAYGEHVSYWNRIPGNYEHWRFSQGYDDGWRTNYAFLAFECATPNGQVAELGFARSWASSNRSHRGDFFWEYEHGFLQGVAAALADFEALLRQ